MSPPAWERVQVVCIDVRGLPTTSAVVCCHLTMGGVPTTHSAVGTYNDVGRLWNETFCFEHVPHGAVLTLRFVDGAADVNIGHCAMQLAAAGDDCACAPSPGSVSVFLDPGVQADVAVPISGPGIRPPLPQAYVMLRAEGRAAPLQAAAQAEVPGLLPPRVLPAAGSDAAARYDMEVQCDRARAAVAAEEHSDFQVCKHTTPVPCPHHPGCISRRVR